MHAADAPGALEPDRLGPPLGHLLVNPVDDCVRLPLVNDPLVDKLVEHVLQEGAGPHDGGGQCFARGVHDGRCCECRGCAGDE